MAESTKFKEEIIKILHWVLKLGHFGKQVRNNWKVLKYDAGEGWRSVGLIM
jgi:hypothetical protein